MGYWKIERGNYHERKYWKSVAVGAPEEDRTGKVIDLKDGSYERNAHWYWMSDAAGVSSGASTKPEPVHKALFWELRPEEWDSRPRYSRLVKDCAEEGCVNPWHWSVQHPTGKQRDEFDRVRAYSALELDRVMSDSDLIDAYRAYIALLKNENGEQLVLSLGFQRTGKVHTELGAFKKLDPEWGPLTVAKVENWLAMDPMPTLEESEKQLEVVEQRYVKAMLAASQDFNARLARAMGEAKATRARPRPHRRRVT